LTTAQTIPGAGDLLSNESRPITSFTFGHAEVVRIPDGGFWFL